MHKAVELILKRMESHPEEFVDARMKQMIEPFRQYLTAEEKEALKAKEREIHLDTLHVRVMKQILADKEPEDNDTIQRSLPLGAQIMPAGPAVSVTQQQLEMRRQWDQMRSQQSSLGGSQQGVQPSAFNIFGQVK